MASRTSSTSSALPSPEPLLLATRSDDKAREIRAILGSLSPRPIRTLVDLAIPESPDEDAIESESTFRGNALAKARYFHALTGLDTIADDSGIQVDALLGAPGVRSRRFSGASLRGSELDRANNDTLLEALALTPPARRGARYTCAAVLLLRDRPPLTALASTTGRILSQPRGDGGFGYDPLFLLPPFDRTFAEIPPSEKHRVSHRGRAFRALAAVFPAASDLHSHTHSQG